MPIFSNHKKAMRKFFFLAAWLLVSCGSKPSSNLSPEPRNFEGDRALSDVAWQLELGPRVPGGEAHTMTGDRIIEELGLTGWEVQEQTFEYEQTSLRNIIASQGSSDGPLIIIGAHYDTRPISDRDLEFPTRPVPGANDGASGVAVLLELARSMPPGSLNDCQFQLVFFDAEDSGGAVGWPWSVGARHFVETLAQSPESVVVVDMIGDAELEVFYEANSTPELREQIWQSAAALGYEQFTPELRHSILDDHTPFLQNGIPAAVLIDFDYPYWHTQRIHSTKYPPAAWRRLEEPCRPGFRTAAAETWQN